MKILYVGPERTDAAIAAGALHAAAQNVTVLWTPRLEHLALWLDQNPDLGAVIVDAQADRIGWRPLLELARRLPSPPGIVAITFDGAASWFDPIEADEFLTKDRLSTPDLAVAVERAVDRAHERRQPGQPANGVSERDLVPAEMLAVERAARTDVEQQLAQARAALEDAEERHRVAAAVAAEDVARHQARYEIALARAAATWEMVDEQLRDAASQVERSGRDTASAAAKVDQLLRRELQLSSRLAEAASTRLTLERRIADMTAALEAANVGAKRAAEREATLDEQLREERATRVRLQQTVAEADAALHELRRQHDWASTALAQARTERQAEFDRELAHAAAARDDLAQRLTDAEAALQEVRKDYQSAAAHVERLTEREAGLATQLAEVHAGRSVFELQLAEAVSAMAEADERAAHERASAADRQADLEARLAQAIDARDILQRTLAETRSSALHAEQSLNEEIEALRTHGVEQASQFEAQLADERRAHGSRLAEALECNHQRTLERDALKGSLNASEEQLHQLDAALAARDHEIENLRAEIRTATQNGERRFEEAQLAMFRCSPDGALTQANQAWSALVRRTIDDLRGGDFAAAVFESPNDLSWLIARSLSTSTKESIETTLRRKDGSRLFVRLSARASASQTVEIVAEDLTRVRVLQDRLAQAARMEAVGRLASEVALTCGALLIGARENARRWLTNGDGAALHHGQLLLDELTRAGSYLQQLVAYGDQQRRAPTSVDLPTVVRNLAPVLKHVAGGHVEVRLPARSSSLTVDIDTEHVERLLVNLAAYGRERMPSGGRLTIEVGTSIVNRQFTARYPNVRPGPHALITVREARRPPRADRPVPFRGGPIARDARGTIDQKRGIELGTIQGLVGDCGGHLWMKVEPLGDIVAKIRLPLLTSDGQTHTHRLAAVGSRARAITRWFQH